MQWISVEDELPEFTHHAGSDCFVLVIGNGCFGVGEYMYSSHNGWTHYAAGVDVDAKVSHWMPLPKPPEGN